MLYVKRSHFAGFQQKGVLGYLHLPILMARASSRREKTSSVLTRIEQPILAEVFKSRGDNYNSLGSGVNLRWPVSLMCHPSERMMNMSNGIHAYHDCLKSETTAIKKIVNLAGSMTNVYSHSREI